MMAATPHTIRNPSEVTGILERRAYISIYTSAIVDSLTRIGTSGKNLNPDAHDNDYDDDDDEYYTNEEEDAAYEEFTKAVFETLLKYDRLRLKEMGYESTPEEETWSIRWRGPIGTPLAKLRWDQLLDHDVVPNLDLTIRESHTDHNIGHERKSGGGVQAIVDQVARLGYQYLRSYRGFDDCAPDGGLHNSIRQIGDGVITNPKELVKCHRSVDYRMNTMKAADSYLRAMGIPPPQGKSCIEFDTRRVQDKIVGRDHYGTIDNQIRARRILFPRPIRDQCWFFSKSWDYLVAAIHFADFDSATIGTKLDELAVSVRQEIDYHRNLIKNIPEIREKRQKLFHAFGINHDDI